MFELVNSWLALGAAAGSIPVIIHLLNRRRFRIVRWAAMEFLLASLRKNYKRIRMENLLLLALRVLMVVLLALALARPRLTESSVLAALGVESRHVIILIDESFSMGYREGAATSFSKARDVALQVLQSLNPGDVVSILAVSDATRAVIRQATLEIELAKSEVKRAEPGWGGTDLRQAIVAAADLLGSTRKPRKEIFVITDMQALAWGRKDQPPSAELKAAIDRIQKEAQLFLVDVGSDGPDNLAVTRLAPRSRIVGTGSPTEFETDIANFGRARKSGVVCSFLVDKFNQDAKPVDRDPAQSDSLSFTHSFQAKGFHVVQVQLPDDRLRADNTRHLAVRVEDAVPVLLVNGETSPELDQNETYFLERALKPPTAEGSPRFSHIEPTTVTEFGLSATDFARYRLAVLANLASLAAENAVPRLEDYVRQGGALLIFLGDRVDAAFYNDQLFKSGRGLLPAQLGPEAGSIGPDRKPVHIELVKPVHPAFQFFTDDKAFFLTRSALFYRYFELKLPTETENIRVIARFDTGSPAIVEKTFGRGRVVLFASSADTEWNNFPTSPAYLVVMQDLMSHLASSDLWQRNVIVHQPYRQTFGPEELVDAVTVHPPGDASLATKLRPYQVRPAAPASGAAEPPPAITEIVFTQTHVAGLYELEFETRDASKRPPEYFAVNVPPDESDLRRCRPEDVQAALKGLTFKYAKSLAELNVAVRQSRSGRDFARALLISVLVISCVELILGQRFGR